jgi:hypothetical protein
VLVVDEGKRLRFSVKCLKLDATCEDGHLETFWVLFASAHPLAAKG